MAIKALLISAIIAICIQQVFCSGSGSLTLCDSGTRTYVSGSAGGPSTVYFITCGNSGSTQAGTVTRTTNSITNSVAGLNEITYDAVFTNTCPINYGSSFGGGATLPTACYAVFRTDVTPPVMVPGTGACQSSGTLNINTASPLVRKGIAGAKYQWGVYFTQGTGSCTLRLSSGTLYVDNPAKK